MSQQREQGTTMKPNHACVAIEVEAIERDCVNKTLAVKVIVLTESCAIINVIVEIRTSWCQLGMSSQSVMPFQSVSTNTIEQGIIEGERR